MRAKILIIVTALLVAALSLGAFLVLTQPDEGVVFSTKFSSDKLKFCVTGDTGKATEIQKQVAGILKNEQCDRIIIVGDIIYPKGISSPNDPQVRTKFEDFYFPLTLVDKKPKVALISGNHDYQGNFRAWIELAKEKKWILMPSRYYMEEVAGFCFYYLDSMMFTRAAYRWDTIPQMQWIQNTRKQYTNSCHTEIVLTHHPYLSVGNHANADGYLKWMYDWLVVGESDFLISGHAHLVKDFGEVGKTQMLISGAGGSVEKGFDGGILVLELDLKNNDIFYYFTGNSTPKDAI